MTDLDFDIRSVTLPVDWQNLQRERISIDESQCIQCGDDQNLHVTYRKDPETEGFDVENMATLCEQHTQPNQQSEDTRIDAALTENKESAADDLEPSNQQETAENRTELESGLSTESESESIDDKDANSDIEESPEDDEDPGVDDFESVDEASSTGGTNSESNPLLGATDAQDPQPEDDTDKSDTSVENGDLDNISTASQSESRIKPASYSSRSRRQSSGEKAEWRKELEQSSSSSSQTQTQRQASQNTDTNIDPKEKLREYEQERSDLKSSRKRLLGVIPVPFRSGTILQEPAEQVDIRDAQFSTKSIFVRLFRVIILFALFWVGISVLAFSIFALLESPNSSITTTSDVLLAPIEGVRQATNVEIIVGFTVFYGLHLAYRDYFDDEWPNKITPFGWVNHAEFNVFVMSFLVGIGMVIYGFGSYNSPLVNFIPSNITAILGGVLYLFAGGSLMSALKASLLKDRFTAGLYMRAWFWEWPVRAGILSIAFALLVALPPRQTILIMAVPPIIGLVYLLRRAYLLSRASGSSVVSTSVYIPDSSTKSMRVYLPKSIPEYVLYQLNQFRQNPNQSIKTLFRDWYT